MSVDFNLYDVERNRLVGADEGVNFGNANATTVLTALGFDATDLWGELDPRTVLEALERLERAMLQGRGAEFARSEERGERFISFGLNPRQTLARACALGALARDALAQGLIISYA